MKGQCDGNGVLVNRGGGPGGQWVNAECPGCPACWSAEDYRTLHQGVSLAIELYDGVEKEGGVPPHAPLYGKRDRLVELARRLDHEANSRGQGGDRGLGRSISSGAKPYYQCAGDGTPFSYRCAHKHYDGYPKDSICEGCGKECLFHRIVPDQRPRPGMGPYDRG